MEDLYLRVNCFCFDEKLISGHQVFLLLFSKSIYLLSLNKNEIRRLVVYSHSNCSDSSFDKIRITGIYLPFPNEPTTFLWCRNLRQKALELLISNLEWQR